MNLDALYQQACQMQDLSLACDLFARILAQDPTYPNAAFHWGRHRHQSGDLQQAEALYVQELHHRPDFWACRANLAQLYTEQKRFQEALSQIQQAQRDCGQADFQVELLQLQARIHRALEQYSEAAQCLQVALQIAPGADLYRDAARNALALNQSTQASNYYQRAMLHSQDLKLLIEVAQFFNDSQHYAQALLLFEKAQQQLETDTIADSQRRRVQAELAGKIANIYQDLNQAERSRELYQQAIQSTQSDALRISRALVLPQVYSSQASADQWFLQFQQELQSLQAASLTIEHPLDISSLPFYLAYQDHNLKTPLEQVSQLYRRFLPSWESGAFEHHKHNKLRVGCVSHFFYRHSVMNCFAQLLLGLPQAGFELHCFAASNFIQDDLTRQFQQVAHWHRLQGPLLQQLNQIREQELDILLFSDMGLDPHCYVLAHYRLAPVQLLLPGQPLTSGISTLDGFISDILSEPPDAQAHYCETLIQLPAMPTIFSKPHLRVTALKRPYWGWSTQQHLYLCPAQAFKLHPAMDTVFIEILQQDPQAVLVFLDINPERLIRDVLRRLSQMISPATLSRIRVLPRQSGGDFLALLECVDVVLESFPFGSFNTIMTAFALGIPVLCFPGEYLRGRYALGIYRQLGIEGPIARSPAEYVQLALKLAHDKAYRRNLQYQIERASDRLFDNHTVAPLFHEVLRSKASESVS